MADLAIATHADQPGLTADDELLGEALTRQGVTWTAVPWTSAEADWSRYGAVLIRSTWDYHEKTRAFLAWIASLDACGTIVWNPANTIRRNINKRYLKELASAGVTIVPTTWLARGTEHVDVRSIASARGWAEIIAKPAISAGGRGIIRWSAADDHAPDEALAALAADSDVLVQPFLPEVLAGELSFIFFDGVLSHVVQKVPRTGDFRVQAKFGGRVERVDPPQALIDQAHRAAELAGGDLYARVDGIPVGDRLIVMEVELTEPDLFFLAAPDAATTFATAIRRRLPAST